MPSTCLIRTDGVRKSLTLRGHPRKTNLRPPPNSTRFPPGSKGILMLDSERRSTRRVIMRVPLKFHAAQTNGNGAHSAAAMNICSHGVYLPTDQKFPKGLLIQVHLQTPREGVGADEVAG